MTDLALDPFGDLEIANGDLVLIRDAPAIAQDINLRVALFKGEWPLDRRVGIDYQGLIFGPRLPNTVIRAIYDQVLRETAGVQSVSRLRLQFESGSRTMTITATVIADDGSTIPVYRDILLEVTPPSASNNLAQPSITTSVTTP